MTKPGFRRGGDVSRAGNGVAGPSCDWLLGGGCWVEESLKRGRFRKGVFVVAGVEGMGDWLFRV